MNSDPNTSIEESEKILEHMEASHQLRNVMKSRLKDSQSRIDEPTYLIATGKYHARRPSTQRPAQTATPLPPIIEIHQQPSDACDADPAPSAAGKAAVDTPQQPVASPPAAANPHHVSSSTSTVGTNSKLSVFP